MIGFLCYLVGFEMKLTKYEKEKIDNKVKLINFHLIKLILKNVPEIVIFQDIMFSNYSKNLLS